MRIQLDQNQLGQHPDGLEIGVVGFQDSPENDPAGPAQIYIEIVDGTLWVHVWGSDPTETNPTSTGISPLDGTIIANKPTSQPPVRTRKAWLLYETREGEVHPMENKDFSGAPITTLFLTREAADDAVAVGSDCWVKEIEILD